METLFVVLGLALLGMLVVGVAVMTGLMSAGPLCEPEQAARKGRMHTLQPSRFLAPTLYQIGQAGSGETTWTAQVAGASDSVTASCDSIVEALQEHLKREFHAADRFLDNPTRERLLH